MEGEGIPSRIDKHFLVGMAGGTQNHFRYALRVLGLIAEDGRPTQLLSDLVEARGQDRGRMFGKIMSGEFPELASLPGNASKSDFFAALEGYGVKSADQQRKMLSFFVAAADGAGMEVSSFIRPTKARTGPRRPGTRRARRPSANGTGKTADSTGSSSGESMSDGLSENAMRTAYFNLLIKKAEQDQASDDLLNRIERVVGIAAAPPGSEAKQNSDQPEPTSA